MPKGNVLACLGHSDQSSLSLFTNSRRSGAATSGCPALTYTERVCTLLVTAIAVLGFAMLTVAALVLIRRAAAPALSALRDQGTDGVTGRLPFRRWAACSRLTLGVCVAYRLRATVPAPWSRLSASPRPWRSLLHKPRAASPHAKCHAEGCAVLNIPVCVLALALHQLREA